MHSRESSLQNSALMQCRLPDIRTKALPRVPLEPLTDQLYGYRHVGSKWFSFGPSYAHAYAQVFKLSLLVSMVHVLCYPVNVSYLLHYCLYHSLEHLSQGGCAQCQGAWILCSWWFYSLHMSFAQTCHVSNTWIFECGGLSESFCDSDMCRPWLVSVMLGVDHSLFNWEIFEGLSTRYFPRLY